jgi:hypothetical protein
VATTYLAKALAGQALTACKEYAEHGTIRRSFVFSYQDRSPAEFFIAVMTWGLGPDNRGPARVGPSCKDPAQSKPSPKL